MKSNPWDEDDCGIIERLALRYEHSMRWHTAVEIEMIETEASEYGYDLEDVIEYIRQERGE